MVNFLEQLVAEWYESRGYFVRRNVRVGLRPGGGYEGELDVVAFHPGEKRLVHIEPSMDADSWDQRDKRFEHKFMVGKKYIFGKKDIPGLFAGFEPLPEIEQIALLVFGSAKGRSTIGGAKLLMIGDLLREIREELLTRTVERSVVPEQYQILRALQFVAHYWR